MESIASSLEVDTAEGDGTMLPADGTSGAMRKWLSGRASPCQGEGRGFESRLPLQHDPRRRRAERPVRRFLTRGSCMRVDAIADVAEWQTLRS
jgi:hypothetical protein